MGFDSIRFSAAVFSAFVRPVALHTAAAVGAFRDGASVLLSTNLTGRPVEGQGKHARGLGHLLVRAASPGGRHHRIGTRTRDMQKIKIVGGSLVLE